MSADGLSSVAGRVMAEPLPKRKRGRPSKEELALYGPSKRPVGRPKGDKSRMEEFKVRLLAIGGNRIIDKVVAIAKNDEHPGQMAALKMCMDRMLPMSLFEKDARGGRSAVTINIVSTDGQVTIDGKEEDVIDIEEVDG